MIYGFIYEHPEHSVAKWVAFFQVSRSGYYAFIERRERRERMKKELVIQAFLNAQARHKPKPGTIFHSGRGRQYTSKEFMDTLKLYGIKQSFSRVGMPGDNSWSESFFATRKKECIHFRQFTTRDELRQMVFSWIESFYNNRRVQARLGYMSPREYASWLMSGKQAA